MHKKVIYTTALIVLAAYAGYSQCAMCKAAAESSLENNPNSVARGLNTGIIFLLTIPYAILSIIFRKELFQLIKNIGNKEKTPFNKKSLSKMTFAITFVTCTVVLFAFFITFYKPPA